MSPVPSQLRTVKVPARVPTAFTVEQMCALLAAADSTERPLWWRSLLLASYDTALRLGDLLSIERPDVWPDGSLSIVQSKTGRTHRVKLRAETLKAIDKHLAGRTTGLIWPLWARREALYRAFQKLRQAAGIKSGTLRWIRRSSRHGLAAPWAFGTGIGREGLHRPANCAAYAHAAAEVDRLI